MTRCTFWLPKIYCYNVLHFLAFCQFKAYLAISSEQRVTAAPNQVQQKCSDKGHILASKNTLLQYSKRPPQAFFWLFGSKLKATKTQFFQHSSRIFPQLASKICQKRVKKSMFFSLLHQNLQFCVSLIPSNFKNQ